MSKQKYDSVAALQSAGISFEDATALRRISMTLRRWFEMECGTDSGAIEREQAWAIKRAGAALPFQWWNGTTWGKIAERRTYTDTEHESLRGIWASVETWREHQNNPDNPRLPFDAAWRETGSKPYWTYDLGENGKRGRNPIADRERGAQRRLAAIMAQYPNLRHYVQSDPRGAALYILRRSDIPAGQSADSCYSRGIVVCQ